ncbi:hydrolase or metal-binding protein [Herbaspirillum sp. WGmk3]|uniref:recombination directionality factor n=1 Tax=Herbaspirillum sp. WGmk3 TaxID=2919925 RepID=UPI002090EDA9|nr:hydrolase or metal-binding protein [Herbaspirillum sp. WGmk3]MCO4856050.1 hydrolase or metal-binding protein [Herbaspirillum sp. WGmk3]
MIKGLCITPPVLGRISIGKMVEKNGRRLPEKDDQFTITSQVQTHEGWAPHPLDAIYRKASPAEKLRTIPVTVMFSEPDLNLRASYCFFDRHAGRPLCSGNGMHCRRLISEGVSSLPCPGPDTCEFGQGQCKPYGRLNVQIDAADELGTFIFRTTGYNSIRTLTARLQYYQAVSGGLLASLPLELRLRGKSTAQSHRTPIYYVDLTIREGIALEGAIQQARDLHQRRMEAGFDQMALDLAAKAGLANGVFEESEEEFSEVKEEFFNSSLREPNLLQDSAPAGLSKVRRAALRSSTP